MLVSYNWLNTYFDGTLPPVDEVERLLTFHAWEVEEVVKKGDDHIIEVNVLPDTSSWALSHRGVAKNLSVILNKRLSRDPLATEPALEPKSQNITIDIQSDHCIRYSAVRIDGVKVGSSPKWLKERIEAIGQKSINNIVDAANYVMFDMGQPLHAFDADKLGGGEKDSIAVRSAEDKENITTLTGETYELTSEDLLIVDGTSDMPVGIAGIKGGKVAEVDERSQNLLIESANFDQTATRRSSQRLKLRTDASARYENGVVQELTGYGLEAVAKLIIDIAGGVIVGYQDAGQMHRETGDVAVKREQINSLLGLTLSMNDIEAILKRFGYQYKPEGDTITLTPPFERADLLIAEDLIEEIGRIYGYEHVAAVTPTLIEKEELNKRFFYAERVRHALVGLGFSEIYTSSFRNKDEIKLANALASDKGYLRSTLSENMREALERNRMNADLLGIPHVAMFEIGTVFTRDGEHSSLVFGVWSLNGYTAKKDDQELVTVLKAVSGILGDAVLSSQQRDGIVEINFDKCLEMLPDPEAYDAYEKTSDVTYAPFSIYPFVSRDVALWTEGDVSSNDVEKVLNEAAGGLRARTTLFDEFEKEGKVSYAFRVVFQSNERTLTDSEVNTIMDDIISAIGKQGWEVR